MSSLNNPEMHRTTARNIRDLMQIFFKRFRMFAVIFSFVVIGLVVGTLSLKPVYEATTLLKIEDTNYRDIGLSGQPRRGSDLLLRKEQQINSEIDIANGSQVREGVVRKLELWKTWELKSESREDRISEAMVILQGSLSVKPSLDSWVIKISYQAHKPETAAAIANAVAVEYMKQNIILNTLPEAAEFYKDKLDKEKRELRTLQNSFLRLKDEKGVVAYDAEVTQKIKSRATFQDQFTEVRKEILSKRAVIKQINRFLEENTDTLIPIPQIAEVRIVEDLNYRLANAKIALESLLEKYTEKGRQVINAREQIKDLENQIRVEVRKIIGQQVNELKSLEATRNALESSIRTIDQELLATNSIEPEYKNFERDILDKQGIISDLNKKYTNSLYAGETDTRLGRVKVISKATVPTDPVSPNLKFNLLVGIPLAFLLGLAVIILLEYADRSFSTPEKVEMILALPVLATVNQTDLKRNPLLR